MLRKIVLAFTEALLLLFLLSCHGSNQQYTSSLIFEENQGVYVVVGILTNETQIVIPQKYKGKPLIIGEEAFADCTFLESVEINCYVIGKSAFENCTNIRNLTIGNAVSCIEENAFANTKKLSQIMYLAENIGSIPGGTFLNSGTAGTGIKLTIGSQVQMVPGWFFSACDNVYLKSVSWEENSQCTYIGPFAFYHCDDLTSMIIPKNVVYIGHHCFSGCKSLKTISFENRQEDWKIHDYRDFEEYLYIVNSDTVKNETDIAQKLIVEYNSFDWRR